MQTIKLEKNEIEWVRGQGGSFRPASIRIIRSKGGEYLNLGIVRTGRGKPEILGQDPIHIFLKIENWKKVLVALGEELGR